MLSVSKVASSQRCWTAVVHVAACCITVIHDGYLSAIFVAANRQVCCYTLAYSNAKYFLAFQFFCVPAGLQDAASVPGAAAGDSSAAGHA